MNQQNVSCLLQVFVFEQGTSYAPPGFARMPGTSVGFGTSTGVGTGAVGAPYSGRPQDIGTAGGGTDQREVITPPGGRPAGRSRPSQSPIRRHADRGKKL